MGAPVAWYLITLLTIFLGAVLIDCSLEESDPSVAVDHFPRESSALLQFKQGLHLLPGMLSSWKMGTYLCHWEGVACDELSGFVTALQLPGVTCTPEDDDISDSNIDSALFELENLRVLNLSNNGFCGVIPKEIAKFTNLHHLDLSGCCFSGDIPPEIFQMTQLRSINLSANPWFGALSLPSVKKPPVLKDLQELRLDNVRFNMSGEDVSKMFFSSLPNLQTLSLIGCHIDGPISESFLHLPSLSYLDLSDSNQLVHVPEFFVNLTSLRVLKLSNCHLQGNFPSDIFLLPELEDLQIYGNQELVVSVPSSSNTHLLKCSKIQSLHLSNTKNMENNLEFFSHLTKLTVLYMSESGIRGSLPSSWHSLGIQEMDLSWNNVSGPLPEWFASLSNLIHLSLSSNQLSGAIPSALLTHPYLISVNLSNNRLSGDIPSPSHTSPLQSLSLENNQLSGDIPSILYTLSSLRALTLHNNRLTGLISSDPLMFSNTSSLWRLDLGNNHLSGIINLPLFSCMKNVVYLNISHNHIAGQIPAFFSNFSALQVLDVSNNSFTGVMPDLSNSNANLRVLDVSNNALNDTFPYWLCNSSYLNMLSLKSNRFWGNISLMYLEEPFPMLKIFDISNNVFSGHVPVRISHLQFPHLALLDLSNNSFHGKIPRFLSNCTGLISLNLGNNELTDTFPLWLGNLTKLKILILRSNHLVGKITTISPSQHAFRSLRILDLSANRLSGSLSALLFLNFQAMRAVKSTNQSTFIHMTVNGVTEIVDVAITQRIKGRDMIILKVLEAMNIIDVSNNLFSGEIPSEIGELQGLYQLNISHNKLSGFIPISLGCLHQLESLDLSENHLSGSIPMELAAELTNLEVLNLSFNDLQGSVPRGKQFDTFTEFSFAGNPKLCGPPLTKQCSSAKGPGNGEEEDDGNDQGQEHWEWVYGATGIGFAVGLGILTLPVVLIRRVGDWYWDQIDRMAKCLLTCIASSSCTTLGGN